MGMILSQKLINYFRCCGENLNITYHIEKGKLFFKIKNIKTNQTYIKKINYTEQELTTYLFKDDYKRWKNMTDKLKESYFSHDSFLENAEIPPFSRVFYYLFYSFERIPSPEEFFDGYVSCYCQKHKDGETFHFRPEFKPKRGERGKALPPEETLYLNSLKCRITRAYPSFIREVACCLMLSEYSDNDIDIGYNLNKDIFSDTDLIAINKTLSSTVSISLYNNSSMSVKKRIEKEQNNCSKQSFKIAVLANLFGTEKNVKSYGSIELYDYQTIKTIINIINSYDKGYFVVGQNR